MIKLLNCPFCECDRCAVTHYPFGGDEILGNSYLVKCPHCMARGPEVFEENDAIKSWNHRPSAWVSVKERLPEKQGEFLVYSISDPRLSVNTIPYRGVACFAQKQKGGQQVNWNRDFRDGFYIDSMFAEYVTHWQPLPEPPEDV